MLQTFRTWQYIIEQHPTEKRRFPFSYLDTNLAKDPMYDRNHTVIDACTLEEKNEAICLVYYKGL